MLVVREICTGEYGAGRVGERSARGDERFVGRSAAGAAVGVAEKVAKRAGNCRLCDRYSYLSTVATSLLADAFNARDSLRSMFSVGDFSLRSSWLI